MILNAYAILSGFTVVLRGLMAIVVIGLACKLLLGRERGDGWVSKRTESENRFYLLSLSAGWLLGLNLISWPLLYLLLQSYVPQWPGVMCIYGVTKIGAGSLGVSRFLPGLIGLLQCFKPTLLFFGGVWWVLHRILRATRTGTLLQRVVLAQLMLGWLALADALMEGAYLVIPKREEFLFTGCCTMEYRDASDASATWLSSLTDGLGPMWMTVVYYLTNFGLMLGMWQVRRRGKYESVTAVGGLLLGVLLAVPVTVAYWVELAAPAVLRLPYHHCLYDLIPNAPDMIMAMVLFVVGSCCVGWASVVRCLAVGPETETAMSLEIERLLSTGWNCYLGSLVMVFLEVSLA